MHKNECDRCGGQRCSEENMEELCQEGHEGYGYKRENSAGPLFLAEYNWGPTRASADALHTMCIWSHGRQTHMIMMNSSISKTWMLPLEFCSYVVCVHAEILLLTL